MTAQLSICFERGKGKELRIRATATNHRNRRGYVRQFTAEFAGEAPFHTMSFVPERGKPVAVEPSDEISFEWPIPLDYFPAIKDRMTLTLHDTSGRKYTKKFQTIDQEVLKEGDFTGPRMPPMPPGV